MSIETVVEKIEQSVVAEVKKIEGETVAVAKAAVVQTTTEEKLFLREAELEFLKANMEIQRIQKIAEGKSKEYQTYVENLFKKYVLDKAEYVFDGSVNAFKKL
jgi:hypothetical protein